MLKPWLVNTVIRGYVSAVPIIFSPKWFLRNKPDNLVIIIILRRESVLKKIYRRLPSHLLCI